MSLRKFFRRLFESRPAPSDIKIVIAKAPREWNMKECALAMGYGASKYKAAAWSAKWGHAPLSFPNRPLYPYKLAEFDQAVSRLHRAGICKPFVHEISTNADIDRVIASRLKQKETAMKVVEFIVPFKRFGRGLTQEWSQKEKAILKALTAIGVNETAVLQRVSMDRYGSMKVRCRPEQFAQFMIDRNKFGGENWFTELSPTMTAHPAEAKFGQPVLFDVTDYANKFCNVMNFNINSDPVKDGQTTEVCAAIRAETDRQRAALDRAEVERLAQTIGKPMAVTQKIGETLVELSSEVRDRTLEEVALAYEAFAVRSASRPHRNMNERSLALQSADRSKRNAEFVRSLKGGVTFKERQKKRAIEFYSDGSKQFAIPVSPAVIGPDGLSLSGKLPAYILPGSDAKVVKIVGHNVYLGVEDPRLDWTQADRIPFKKAEG